VLPISTLATRRSGAAVFEARSEDAIRFDKDTMRDMEAGPDGVDYLAFGAGEDATEVEMVQSWWTTD
jgi:hypothetical protein